MSPLNNVGPCSALFRRVIWLDRKLLHILVVCSHGCKFERFLYIFWRNESKRGKAADVGANFVVGFVLVYLLLTLISRQIQDNYSAKHLDDYRVFRACPVK